jgi:hypothetical protein
MKCGLLVPEEASYIGYEFSLLTREIHSQGSNGRLLGADGIPQPRECRA